jgi:heme-degrading monooxygenase HmoA
MLNDMTGYHLAQVNVGRLVGPLESTELADFVAELPRINQLADRSPGFVWRMVEEGNEDATALRPDEDDKLLLINCSVWESLEALRDFTYQTDHLRVLSRRREWFHRIQDTHQALWWVPAGHRPTVAEAMERVARVRDHGPGPLAFTFPRPYPAPDGAAPQERDGSAAHPA